MDAEKLYKNHEKLLLKLSWKFYKKNKSNPFFKAEIEDVISEANLAFAYAQKKYKPEIAAFSTLLQTAVNNHFKNVLNNFMAQKNTQTFEEFKEWKHSAEDSFERDRIFLNEIKKAMGTPMRKREENRSRKEEKEFKAAKVRRDILEFILNDAPANFKLTKKSIRNHFRKLGVNISEIDRGFAWIKNIILSA